jgi:hypothetical protein
MADLVTVPRHDVGDVDHCLACADCRRTHNKRARAHAQGRALSLLARTFPIEYAALYLSELAKEDLVAARSPGDAEEATDDE